MASLTEPTEGTPSPTQRLHTGAFEAEEDGTPEYTDGTPDLSAYEKDHARQTSEDGKDDAKGSPTHEPGVKVRTSTARNGISIHCSARSGIRMPSAARCPADSASKAAINDTNSPGV